VTCDVIAFANEGVSGLTPYEPGKPIEDLQRELGLSEVIKLASNESPLGPAPGALEAARSALLDVARYPDGNGFELKARLAGMLNVAAAQITLGNGSNDVLEFVARAFAGPGAEIVYSEHAFVVYPISARLVGAKGIAVPARDFGHDLDAMAQAVTANTRVVYIANPNNPTGTWVDADALAAFVRALPEHVVVVVDEAYREYVDDKAYPDCVQWLDESPNLVVTRTFSKAYGLAGLRVGYAVCHPQIADLMNRVRQPFNVNSVALAAAHAALADDDHLKRAIALNDKGLGYLESELQRLELPYIPSIGNFISFELPCDALPVYQALLREGVIVRPIGAYGMPRHLRVSVGLGDENQRFVQALERVLAGGVNDHD
jgi:histidinol-phosphate aminotransferase